MEIQIANRPFLVPTPKLGNSWQFASILDRVVTEYLCKHLDTPIKKEVIARIKQDFEHGVTPSNYQMEAHPM